MAGMLFLLVGPSGVGKSTLARMLLQDKRFQGKLERVRTYTTRLARSDASDKDEYHFCTSQEFERLLHEQFFLESACVGGYYYGVPHSIKETLNTGASVVLVVTRAGALKLRSLVPAALVIWIEPPSIDDLKSRLLARTGNLNQEIYSRLARAEEEMAAEKQSMTSHYKIINDDLDASIKRLGAIFDRYLNVF